VPVTARLSSRFYEKLGDDVANELVEWFNSVDATYRLDLREINDLNFARFEAKLEQRVGLVEAKMDARFAEVDARTDARIAGLEARLLGRLDAGLAEVRRDLTTRIVGWNFAFWVTTLLAILGSRLL
jgi:hypothetical protein